MKTSQTGIDLIKKFEGYRSESYDDGGGVWTIGYGHTNSVLPLQKTTPEQAEKFLRDDLANAERAVNKLVTVSISQAQFDALVSLIFNIGAGAFASSTLLKKLNTKDYYGAREQFKRWNKDNGKVLVGLSRRRAAEAELFMPSIEVPLPKTDTMKVASVTGALGAVTAATSTLAIIEPALPVVRQAASVAQDYPLGALIFGGLLLIAVSGFMIWKCINNRAKGIK